MSGGRRWLAPVVLGVLLATACGGDDDAGDGGEASPPATTESVGGEAGELTASFRGVTEDTIKLGFAYSDLEALAASGVAAIDHGPYEDLMQVLVDDLNADGGIGGRQVEMVYGGFAPIGAEEQLRVCTQLTEDEQVFAVLGGLRGDNTLCVTEQHETIVVGAALSEERLERSVAPWITSSVTAERTMAAFVELLDRTGELAGRTIAVHASAGADRTVAEEVVIPQLEAAGYEVAYTSLPDVAEGDLQATSDAVEINVERMKGLGVDAVFMVGGSLSVEDFAENDFLPHIYTTSIGLTRVLSNGTEVDLGAFPSFVTVGSSSPDLDAQNPAFQECISIWEEATGKEILSQAEEEAQGESSGRVGLRVACDNLRLFTAAAEAAGPELTNDSFLTGAESVGEISLPGARYASFAPDKYDGDDAFALFRWDPSADGKDKFVPDEEPRPLDG